MFGFKPETKSSSTNPKLNKPDKAKFLVCFKRPSDSSKKVSFLWLVYQSKGMIMRKIEILIIVWHSKLEELLLKRLQL